MSSLTIILIIAVALGLIIAPVMMLNHNKEMKIPKDFKNEQGYDKDEDEDKYEGKDKDDR